MSVIDSARYCLQLLLSYLDTMITSGLQPTVAQLQACLKIVSVFAMQYVKMLQIHNVAMHST